MMVWSFNLLIYFVHESCELSHLLHVLKFMKGISRFAEVNGTIRWGLNGRQSFRLF